MITFRIVAFQCLAILSAAARAQNSVPNGDFDSGSTGWSGGTLSEVDGSPSAPSYQVAAPGNNQNTAQSDCFLIPGSRQYLFSGNVKVISGNIGFLNVDFFQDTDCMIYLGEQSPGASGDISWASKSMFTFVFPHTPASARISLTANSIFTDPAISLFDHISLVAVDIFVDGFEP